MNRLLALVLAPMLALTPIAPHAEDDGEGVLIVQLSLFATAGKCAQAGLEFSADEWTKMGDFFRRDAEARQLSREDQNRLWTLGVGLSERQVNAAACAKARTSILSWFPAGVL